MKLQAILRNEPKKITAERQSAINRPARASAAYTAISLFSKACAFVFTPIFTRLLTAEEYGEFSLFLSCLSLLTVVGGLELSGGVITRAYQRRPDDSHLTLLIAAGISLASTAAASTVIYLFRNAAFGELHFGNAYILLFTASISTSVIGLYLSKCRFLYKWKPALAAALLQSAASPILPPFLPRWRPSTPDAARCWRIPTVP